MVAADVMDGEKSAERSRKRRVQPGCSAVLRGFSTSFSTGVENFRAANAHSSTPEALYRSSWSGIESEVRSEGKHGQIEEG